MPNARDPNRVTIHLPYAVREAGTTYLGGDVEPDKFIVKVLAWEPGIPNINLGDYFKAAFMVGTSNKPGKYGTNAGLVFKVTGMPSVQGFPGAGPGTKIHNLVLD